MHKKHAALLLFALTGIAHADTKTITENSFGCVSEQAFKDGESYLFNHETELLQQELNSGQCVMLHKGQQVILVDVSFLSYAVVRIPNDPTKLYTFFTTIK
ncbi:hypothetical protein [Pararobbsia alpina]|uniref:Uncharacterized protein n=1 Tax=Pararobbsia alpina TaxID=621374 RepID=A0A6S7BCW9_9BURK|nr:hypothetical protein [Pararobbsia alpina]CAB3784543.1 hypothetical protein LMG28138_01830 [Pararobbsia alpina]